MKFQEIFNEEGLYVADGFSEGSCFKVDSYGFLKLVTYNNKDSIKYSEDIMPVSKSLFKKDYRKVWTRQSLFK